MKALIPLLAVFLISASASAQQPLLPNPKLTPGRVAESDKDRAGVTVAMEQKVFARYRLAWASRAAFKMDHLIPRELGGADTIDNLWPQSLHARPYGPDRKELLADVLRLKIARGQMTLAQAQEQIRNDWIDAFVEQVGMVYLK